MQAYTCTYKHTCTSIYLQARVHTYIYIRTSINTVYVHSEAYVQGKNTHLQAGAVQHAYLYTDIYVCLHACLRTHAHVCMYKYRHAKQSKHCKQNIHTGMCIFICCMCVRTCRDTRWYVYVHVRTYLGVKYRQGHSATAKERPCEPPYPCW